MAPTYNRPGKMKYTSMCIYIDKHLEDIAELGIHPDVEETIYQYLYHVVYALSRKAMFFKNFKDYDEFALYAAADLFAAIHKKMHNAGKVIKGKTIMPLKSSLNYIKAVLHPLRVNYQQTYYQNVIDPEIGQDTSRMTYALKESIQMKYSSDLKDCCEGIADQLPMFLSEILLTTPYRNDKVMLLRLFNSCMLSLCSQLTLPNYKKRILNIPEQPKNLRKREKTIADNYFKNSEAEDIVLWRLEDKYHDYVQLLVRKLKETVSIKLREDIHQNDLSENMIDSIITSTFNPTASQNTED